MQEPPPARHGAVSPPGGSRRCWKDVMWHGTPPPRRCLEKLWWHQKQSPPGKNCSRLEALPKKQAGSRGCSGKGWGEVASRRQIGFGVGSRSDSAAPIPQQSPGEAGGTAHKPMAGRAGAWREPGREGKGFFLGGEAGRVSTRLLTTKARGQTCTQIRFPLTCLPACPCHSGISGKSQVLFALVFTTRYLDLFTTFISAYNTVMKVRRGSTKEVSLGWPWFAGEGEGAASPPRLSSQREEGETPSPPTITKSTAGYRQKGS